MVPAGSGRIPRGRPYSGCRPHTLPCRVRAFHLVSGAIPDTSARVLVFDGRSYNPPGTCPRGLGWSPFARRYWGSRCCFLFLRVLRCFSSPGSPRHAMDSRGGTPSLGWVAPFGDPRIEACSRLPGAFRSVPRPSSPLDAKASTRCPSLARPAPAAAPPGRRVAYPCHRCRATPERDRHPPVSPASAGPRGSGRPASTTPPHDVKRDRHRRRGAARDRPPGGAGGPGTR